MATAQVWQTPRRHLGRRWSLRLAPSRAPSCYLHNRHPEDRAQSSMLGHMCIGAQAHRYTHSLAQVHTSTHRYTTPVHTGLHRSTQIYTRSTQGLHRHTGLYRCTQIDADLHRSTQGLHKIYTTQDTLPPALEKPRDRTDASISSWMRLKAGPEEEPATKSSHPPPNNEHTRAGGATPSKTFLDGL